MTTRLLYRIAAVLILLLDFGHTVGFPWSDPKWGVNLDAMRTSHFNVLGFNRTYWDFYVGFGLIESVFLLLATILAWQLSNLSANSRSSMRLTAWALAACFAVVTMLSWMYFFIIPIAFGGAITICLLAAAGLSGKEAQAKR